VGLGVGEQGAPVDVHTDVRRGGGHPGLLVGSARILGRLSQIAGEQDGHVPDVGRNLVLLDTRDDAYGEVCHLPNPETRTTRHVIIDVYARPRRAAST
jgi:hypothetical protein